jgi:hypothetical protein
VTAARDGELAGDRREDASDFSAQPDQRRNGNDGNKGQDQGILHEGLAFLIFLLMKGCFHGFVDVIQLV